ncbi:MAG: hypothetical protein HY756_07880 [Nitrospirae bacterium]|nr:hypothetical protein [Nitrospirota bacterium]
MNRIRWQGILAISLIAFSAGIYFIQVRIFHAPRDTFFYLFQDIAFIPIQVLLVTLILNKLLSIREKRIMLKKMNMVIGVFFTEVGTGLLKKFISFDKNVDSIREPFLMTENWTEERFAMISEDLKKYQGEIDVSRDELIALKAFFGEKMDFLIRLLENPNLLEHDSFTDLLWAVFHLAEELANRTDVGNLSRRDHEHVAIDIKRAYAILIIEWLAYIKHLRKDYPYLFSFAIRTNPFNPAASVEFK